MSERIVPQPSPVPEPRARQPDPAPLGLFSQASLVRRGWTKRQIQSLDSWYIEVPGFPRAMKFFDLVDVLALEARWWRRRGGRAAR